MAARARSPFHTLEFAALIADTWRESLAPDHVFITGSDGRALFPAFLYSGCRRLDHYRAAVDADCRPAWPILFAHSLVGWYGFPVADTAAAEREAIRTFLARAADCRASALVGGIDERDAGAIARLTQEGFHVAHFHTLMVRALSASDVNPLDRLPSRYRRSRGQKLRQAAALGVRAVPATPADSIGIGRLLRDGATTKGRDGGLCPPGLLETLMERRLPGMEAILAVDADARPVGVNVNFHFGGRYFVWLGAYDQATIGSLHQSDVLYAAAIARAAALGCDEVQAGRATYKTKLEYGYRPVRLLMAARGHTPAAHAALTRWLTALAGRHLRMYPELQPHLSAVTDAAATAPL
jgi:hypothetical protein